MIWQAFPCLFIPEHRTDSGEWARQYPDLSIRVDWQAFPAFVVPLQVFCCVPMLMVRKAQRISAIFILKAF